MTKHLPTPLPPRWFDNPDRADARDRRPPTPCQRDPAGWDVDRTGVDGLRTATRQCLTSCAVLDACRARVADLSARYTGRQAGVPGLASMVWAGHAYDNCGVRIDLAASDHRGRTDRDTRSVNPDGTVYDGHAGEWVPAPRSLLPHHTHH